MAEPKTPPELADRMRDHRAQRRAHDGFVRETFTQPRDDARRVGGGGPVDGDEFTMRWLRTAD